MGPPKPRGYAGIAPPRIEGTARDFRSVTCGKCGGKTVSVGFVPKDPRCSDCRVEGKSEAARRRDAEASR